MSKSVKTIFCIVAILLLCVLLAFVVAGVMNAHKDDGFIKEGDYGYLYSFTEVKDMRAVMNTDDFTASELTALAWLSDMSLEDLLQRSYNSYLSQNSRVTLCDMATSHALGGFVTMPFFDYSLTEASERLSLKARKVSSLYKADITFHSGHTRLSSKEILLPYELYWRIQLRCGNAQNKDYVTVLKNFINNRSVYDNMVNSNGVAITV